jgi:signal transduction histidine kinase
VVLNIRNINERKQTDAELAEYRKSLEILVAKRTAELNATNEWLSALKRIRQTIGGTADLPQAYDKLFDSILQMLDAKAAFLLRWDGQGGQVETVCHRQRDDAVHALDGIASIVKNDSPLRKKIELGEPIHMSADQAAALPASIGEFFQEDGSRSFLLMPMIAGQSVAGVLGVALHQPKQEITPAQIELVKTITIDLADLAEGTQLLDQAQALVVAEQRNSLASELHDSVTQILFSASVLAEATPRIWGKDQKIAHQNMEKISTLLRGALAEMRSLLFELRSGGPQSQPLEKLLTTLVDAVQARTQITVSKNIDDASEMPENVIQAFYRIAREALNNVVTHADANQVTICLRNEPHCLELRIQDDGRGFDPQEIPVGHLGITIMAERAVQIGGDLQIKSEPGHGTEIVVTWSNKGEES